jgi:hypothetical protein
VLASGNVGCITQLSSHLGALGADVPVLDTMGLLDRAYAAVPRSRAPQPPQPPQPDEGDEPVAERRERPGR